jgi:hypothetical protein
MIWNVIDERRKPHRWKVINAFIEDVAHDNSCADADQTPTDLATTVTYEENLGVSLHEAIVWAEAHAGRVTLYIYDEGEGVRRAP